MSEYIEKIIVDDGEQQHELYTLDTDAIVCAVNEMVEGKRAVAYALTEAGAYTDATVELLADMAGKITELVPGALNSGFSYAQRIDEYYRNRLFTNFSYAFSGDNSLIMFPEVDFSETVVCYHAFHYCTNLRWVSSLNMPKATGTYCLFAECINLIRLPTLHLPVAKDIREMCLRCVALETINLDAPNIDWIDCAFEGCTLLRTIDGIDRCAPTSMYRAFYECTSLSGLILDFSRVEYCDSTVFFGCFNLWNLQTPHLGKSNCVLYDFSPLIYWTDPNFLFYSLFGLSYNRAAAGMETATIILSAESFAALSEEEIAAITAKGYTLTSV